MSDISEIIFIRLYITHVVWLLVSNKSLTSKSKYSHFTSILSHSFFPFSSLISVSYLITQLLIVSPTIPFSLIVALLLSSECSVSIVDTWVSPGKKKSISTGRVSAFAPSTNELQGCQANSAAQIAVKYIRQQTSKQGRIRWIIRLYRLVSFEALTINANHIQHLHSL